MSACASRSTVKKMGFPNRQGAEHVCERPKSQRSYDGARACIWLLKTLCLETPFFYYRFPSGAVKLQVSSSQVSDHMSFLFL